MNCAGYMGQSSGPEEERRLARTAAPSAPVYCGWDDTHTAQDKAVSKARTIPDWSATPPVKQTGGVTVLPASEATRRAMAFWTPAAMSAGAMPSASSPMISVSAKTTHMLLMSAALRLSRLRSPRVERSTPSRVATTSRNRPLPAAQLQTLTPREVQVLAMLAEGYGNKTIAWKLGISEHTAKFHVASILSKLNAGTRTEAVTLGIRRGLILI